MAKKQTEKEEKTEKKKRFLELSVTVTVRWRKLLVLWHRPHSSSSLFLPSFTCPPSLHLHLSIFPPFLQLSHPHLLSIPPFPLPHPLSFPSFLPHPHPLSSPTSIFPNLLPFSRVAHWLSDQSCSLTETPPLHLPGWLFLCGVFMLSSCLCRFSSGNLVSSYNTNTCRLG